MTKVKKETIGRGYSKRTRYTIKFGVEVEGDEIIKFAEGMTIDEIREFVNKPPKGLVDSRDPYVRAKYYRREAEDYLRSRKLLAPSGYPYVFYVNGQWREERPTDEEANHFEWEGSSIPIYVRKQGYKLDSLPDLAARIIFIAWQIEHPIKGSGSNDVISHFMEITRLYTLFKVYLVVDKGRLRSDPIKTKVWEHIARDLMREHDWPNSKKTKEDIWNAISDSEDEPVELKVNSGGITELEYYRDEDELRADVHTPEEDITGITLKKSTFLKKYIKEGTVTP